MNSLKVLVTAPVLKESLKVIAILLILSACGPAAIPVAPTTKAAQPPTATSKAAAQASTSTPEEKAVYPYYLPLATKPDLAPQTIKGVTAQIDWAYVDESRIALHYTISGLDWPDETPWDAMSVKIKSPAISSIGFGGGGWNSSAANHGVITGSSDLYLTDGDLDAGKHPSIELRVDIPVEGPSSVGTFHFKFDVPVMKGVRFKNMNRTIVANDVSMTLKTFIFNPSRVEAFLCFQLPSDLDWGLTASKLNVGSKEYPFAGGGLLPGTNGNSYRLSDAERCSTITFDIQYDESADTAILTVPKLIVSVPEVVDKDRVSRANQRLAASGIEFDYVNVDHGGKIVILKQPEGATDAKIYPLIWEALADQYEGPWVFTIPLKR